MATDTGTNGGWAGMNGAQRRLALTFAAGFLVILGVIMVANATSMVSDFAAAGVPVTTAHVWLWEASSIVAWLTLTPMIWWLVAWLRRSRLAWWGIAAIVALATIPASAWHIGVMVAIRIPVYAMEGERYRFMQGVQDPLLYEYRKDVGTFLQFAGLALIAQWLIARSATLEAIAALEMRTLAVTDGAVTHRVPIDEIDLVSSAGNYVEIIWGERTLLQRTTLAAIEADLGNAFVRVHRSHLVRRVAIRRLETDKSGDFTVLLASGASVRGSRRYRSGI